MHSIKNIRITNFKACSDLQTPLFAYTPIIGYNNAGKSTILEAILWASRPYSLPDNYINKLPVTVQLDITGINDKVLGGIDDKHLSKIKEHIVDEEISIRIIQSEKGQSAAKIIRQILVKGGNPQDDSSWINPTGIKESLQGLIPEPVFIGAMDDSTKDIGRYGSGTTIGKLINLLSKSLVTAHGARLERAFSELTDLLSAEGSHKAKELNVIEECASKSFENFFPGFGILLHIPPPDLELLFKSGTIRIRDDNGHLREIESMGHGVQRTAQISLVKTLSDNSKAGQDIPSTTILIDEPELYLHPQAIEQARFALKNLSQNGYQVIFSTHSPFFIHKDDIKNSILIRKDKGSTIARKTIEKIIEQEIHDKENAAYTLFNISNSSNLLFSDRIIIAEGKTERLIIEDIFECLHSKTLACEKIGTVIIDGSSIASNVLKITKSLDIPTKLIVDFDWAMRHGIKTDFFDESNQLYIDYIDMTKKLVARYPYAMDKKFLPINSSKMRAEDAYNTINTDPNCRDIALRIHQLFRRNQIWVWPFGSIEHHIGIHKKNAHDCAKFCAQLRAKQAEDLFAEPSVIRDLITWIAQW